MTEKIKTVKNRVTAVIKKYKWSTDCAIVEAWSGWMGIPCISSSSFDSPSGSSCANALSSHLHSHGWRPVRVVALTAEHHEHKVPQDKYDKNARRTHDVHHDQSVFSRHRIVLVAVQQGSIGRI